MYAVHPLKLCTVIEKHVSVYAMHPLKLCTVIERCVSVYTVHPLRTHPLRTQSPQSERTFPKAAGSTVPHSDRISSARRENPAQNVIVHDGKTQSERMHSPRKEKTYYERIVLNGKNPPRIDTAEKHNHSTCLC